MRVACRLAVLLVVLATTASASASGESWRLLPPAPIAPNDGVAGAWTGNQLLVFGRATRYREDGSRLSSRDVAASYDPAARRWRALSPLRETGDYFPGRLAAVWTGTKFVVWGPVDESYDPRTNRWQLLARPPAGAHETAGLVVRAGRLMLEWGGGCCGDAFADGVAYDTARDRWRRLPRSPLAGSQHPLGVWTGRELLVFVGNLDPDGKPWPARLARAAAYDPARNAWRRLAGPPATLGETAVWDGREALVVGRAHGLAYDPRANRWRRLPRMEGGRIGAAAVWTGKQLVVWGGDTQPQGATAPGPPGHGLAYDSRTNRWSPLPPAPIFGRRDPVAVWTGTSLLVWGGGTPFASWNDGAAFSPGP